MGSAVSVDVRSNLQDVLASFAADTLQVKEVATVRALNKVAAQVVTASSKEIRAAGYGLKASDIKAQLKVTRATPGVLAAAVVARGRPIGLIKYDARQLGKGVSVNVLNGRKVIAKAFIRQLPNGKQAVLIREADAKHKKVMRNGKATWSALPITQLFGPSVPDAMVNQNVQAALERLIRDRFPTVFASELRYAISKA